MTEKTSPNVPSPIFRHSFIRWGCIHSSQGRGHRWPHSAYTFSASDRSPSALSTWNTQERDVRNRLCEVIGVCLFLGSFLSTSGLLSSSCDGRRLAIGVRGVAKRSWLTLASAALLGVSRVHGQEAGVVGVCSTSRDKESINDEQKEK